MSKPSLHPNLIWVANAAGQLSSEAQRILRKIIDTTFKRTGKEDSSVVTGTAGTDGNIAKWNSDGDLVDGGKATADLLTTANIEDTINDGTTDKAPSENAVYDALALKLPVADPTFTGTQTGPTLRLTATNDASLSSTAHALQVGPTGGNNVIIDTNEIMARNNGATASLFINGEGGNVEVGGSSSLVSLPGGQLKFPATAVPSGDANTIDDVERGTYTPALAFGGGSTDITYGTQGGTYVKLGSAVFYAARILLTAKGTSTGSVTVTLPFTSGGRGTGAVNITAATGLTFGVYGLLSTAATTVGLRQWTSTGSAALADTNFNATTGLDIGGWYST